MVRVSCFIVCFFLFISMASAETLEVREALARFMKQLSPPDKLKGWNTSSDPCLGRWQGVVCSTNDTLVTKLVLDRLNLTGTLDTTSLCAAKNLRVLSLVYNNVVGTVPEDISECSNLAYLNLYGNALTGALPASLSQLNNLKRIYISNNAFVGELPDMTKISGLCTFRAENNRLSSEIPNFNFDYLEEFNVSNNHLSGPIPYGAWQFPASSFSGNPGLCGAPLPINCSVLAPAPAPVEKARSLKRIFGFF